MYGLEGDRVVGGGGERITAEAVSFVFIDGPSKPIEMTHTHKVTNMAVNMAS